MLPNPLASPIAVLLFIITIAVSLFAFKRPKLMQRLAMSPYRVFRKREYERLITSGFVHRDGMHLAFNMITFFFFAFALEAFLGSLKFVLLYLIALVLGGLASYKHRDNPAYNSVGASGAILGVLFAYIVYAPTTTIILFVIPMPAWLYAVGFLAYSYYRSFQSRSDGTDHDAHISGALTGLAFVGLTDPRALQSAVHAIF